MLLHDQDPTCLATIDPPNCDSALASFSAAALMEWAADRFGESLALSTSFGIQSAVTLQLATRVFPEVPVIWIDTGYLPPETYRYSTVGDWHSSRPPSTDDADDRETRFNGLKQECGIHLPNAA